MQVWVGFRRWTFLSIVGFTVLVIGGCKPEKEIYEERRVDELYEEAYQEFEKKSFVKAAKNFLEVERQHPYSEWAPRAQIMASYSYYLGGKFDEASDILETFIQLYPVYDTLDYVYYLLGLNYYEQISTPNRDQEMTLLALRSFQELLARFPNSIYAQDAKLKIDLCRDHLAAGEVLVGRFYQSQHMPIAALNRFKAVIDQYPTTTHVPETLLRLVEVYLSLGLRQEAHDTAAVLGFNFPKSIWYQDAYALLPAPAVPFSHNEEITS